MGRGVLLECRRRAGVLGCLAVGGGWVGGKGGRGGEGGRGRAAECAKQQQRAHVYVLNDQQGRPRPNVPVALARCRGGERRSGCCAPFALVGGSGCPPKLTHLAWSAWHAPHFRSRPDGVRTCRAEQAPWWSVPPSGWLPAHQAAPRPWGCASRSTPSWSTRRGCGRRWPTVSAVCACSQHRRPYTLISSGGRLRLDISRHDHVGLYKICAWARGTRGLCTYVCVCVCVCVCVRAVCMCCSCPRMPEFKQPGRMPAKRPPRASWHRASYLVVPSMMPCDWLYADSFSNVAARAVSPASRAWPIARPAMSAEPRCRMGRLSGGSLRMDSSSPTFGPRRGGWDLRCPRVGRRLWHRPLPQPLDVVGLLKALVLQGQQAHKVRRR